jgi:Rieske Fe-S protein
VNRYVIPAAAVAVAVLIALVLFFQHRAKVEKAKAEAATAQVQVEQEASKETEALRQQTIIIRERGDVAVQHIYETPDAETPVPAGVLSAWRAGIDGVRGKETSKPGDPPAVP